MELVGAVSRTHSDKQLGEVLGIPNIEVQISASAELTLKTQCDVFVEYAKPDIAKSNILQALNAGSHVVVGTSGLTDEDYAEIQETVESNDRGVLAAGNFALSGI